jgi:hypothetical protein
MKSQRGKKLLKKVSYEGFLSEILSESTSKQVVCESDQNQNSDSNLASNWET